MKEVALRRPWLFACLALALAGCGDPLLEKPTSEAEGATGWQAGTSPAGSSTDAAALAAVAERLAGLDPGSEPAWTRHAERMDELWTEIEQRHLEGMRQWRETTLAPLVAEPTLPLHYPFGGPDFLSAFLFFPSASTYVLVGLQPPGRLPGELPTGGGAEGELERLRSGFESLVEAGYFQQTDMDRDFEAERLEGVLPVLYIFLARTGHRPVAVRHIALDGEGRLSEPGAEASAVEIEFVRQGGDERRKLYYFARDLSDEGLTRHPELPLFLRAIGPWNTFMKGAVYLLHMEGFRTLADLLSAESRTLLQDDSGLPLRHLDPDTWDLRFFGAYSQVLPVYREWFQEDLAAAFAGDPGIAPLGFAIGYHSQIGEGCLILANRDPANRGPAYRRPAEP